MTRLLWLPEVLRAAGLTVHEVSGWRTRGSSTFDPRGLICHATAGSSTSTDAGEIRVLLNGSTSAPPPIAQLYLSRSGAWHVVASGRCNHALQGWGGPLKGWGNTHLIGVEAQNDNRGQSWPAVQLDAYQRGVAAICQRMGWTPGRNIAAHREHQPGAKSDPLGIDMTKFRQRVTALLAGEVEDTVTPEDFKQGFYLALAEAANPPAGDAGKRGRQTRDFLRAIVGMEATSPGELSTALAAMPKPDVDALASALAPKLVASLPGDSPITDEQLERVLRRVLGSVDNAAQAG